MYGYINASNMPITKTHTLTFNLPVGSTIVNESEINIDVKFDQVNPTGN